MWTVSTVSCTRTHGVKATQLPSWKKAEIASDITRSAWAGPGSTNICASINAVIFSSRGWFARLVASATMPGRRVITTLWRPAFARSSAICKSGRCTFERGSPPGQLLSGFQPRYLLYLLSRSVIHFARSRSWTSWSRRVRTLSTTIAAVIFRRRFGRRGNAGVRGGPPSPSVGRGRRAAGTLTRPSALVAS